MNAVSKRKEQENRERERERSYKRMILAVGRRSSKFRLIAPPTAPARLYSKDAFRCPNIPTVNIPTRISIRRAQYYGIVGFLRRMASPAS